ncbi:two-component system, chemotaxis family, response regulator CheY [Palleronia marisminoris]|uniref:Chemotaxis protein CheY n=1 Tax=Palleronia marisminoris TaxID=315423 RepID=A0A1Y5RHQ1_9RHOB|nr:response regulator [Palleronia marisminoris]SFG14438.1 two-component system, chemotaxis family, response regulator CheY [Palleronia marisminoris]SLN15109.1 Chemotaxis protein CheY [Palleronia marisminoris]
MSVKDTISILVVDDTSVSRGLITSSLEEIGFKKIDFAKDGESALDHALRKGCHLVISDQNMPGMSGLELLAKLRGHKTTAKVGFILVSGKLDQNLIDDARRHGANNVLAKPFDTPKLRACLKPMLGAV